MTLADWFRNQLLSTAEGFVWAVEQVPLERRRVPPPSQLGEWTAARHVFHMTYYERHLALPHMHRWLGGAPVASKELDEGKAWDPSQNIEHLLATFKNIRNEELALLGQFEERNWHETRETVWGNVTLLWVVSKTFHHTAEHTQDVMQLVLFWDVVLARARMATSGPNAAA